MRKILLKSIVVLLALLFLALAIYLVPPHLQIRSISPEIPTVDELLELERSDGPNALYYINSSEQRLDRGTLAHSAFVFEWPDGKLFLVDAAMGEQEALEFGQLMQTMSDGQAPVFHGDVASLLGSAVSRVAGIGFTHLHIDHTEGVIGLCSAVETSPALLQSPFQRDQQNIHTREGAQLLANSCLKPHDLTKGSIWTSDSFPGLGLIPAGGHTPGSTLFAASIQGQLYVLSGDITNTKASILADSGKGWVYSTLIVPEDTQRTGRLRQWLRELTQHDAITVVVSHDLQDIKASGLPAFAVDTDQR